MVIKNYIYALAGLICAVSISGCGGGNSLGSSNVPTEITRSLGAGLTGRTRGPVQIDTLAGNGTAHFLTMYAGDISFLGYTSSGTLFNQAKIVYTSQRDGNNEIYLMNADGTGVTRVTSASANDTSPTITSDGNTIYFISDRDGSNEIYKVSVAGGVVGTAQRVTNNAVAEQNVVVSPDGSRVMYSAAVGGNQDIYIMNSDGGNVQRLTSNAWPDVEPSFSPDGNRVAFISARQGGTYKLYTMNVDGSSQNALTTAGGNDDYPQWTPDGSKILFMRDMGSGHIEFFMIPAAGGTASQLTSDGQYKIHPTFSPDGQKILCAMGPTYSSLQIWAMSSSGAFQKQLTNSAGNNVFPRMSGTQTSNRVFIGALSSDGGSNPPFGISVGGIIVAQSSTALSDVVGIDAATRSSISINSLFLGSNNPAVGANVSADAVNYLASDNGRGITPTVIIGNGGLYSGPYPNVELFFNGDTGRLTSVLPLTRSRAPGTASMPTFTNNGETIEVSGDFAGVADVAGKKELSHNGAHTVVINIKSGKVISVK